MKRILPKQSLVVKQHQSQLIASGVRFLPGPDPFVGRGGSFRVRQYRELGFPDGV